MNIPIYIKFSAWCACPKAKVSSGGENEIRIRREGAAGVELDAAIRGGGGGSGGDDVGPCAGLIAFEFTRLRVVADHTVDGRAGALRRIPARGNECACTADIQFGRRCARGADTDIASGVDLETSVQRQYVEACSVPEGCIAYSAGCAY